MKILILIIASNDFIHEADLSVQQKTWIRDKHKNVQVLYLRGWNHKSYLLEQDTLFVPCKEDYNLILTKTILGLQYILKNISFDVLVRSNVSTYFETSRLIAEIEKPLYRQEFIGGYFDQYKLGMSNKTQNYEYISGTGIFLSKKAVEMLITMPPDKYYGIFDDIAIFNFFKNSEIKSIRMNRNNLHSTHIFIPTYHIRMKNSFNSESTVRRMLLVHNYFQAKTIRLKLFTYWKICLNEVQEFRTSSEPLYLFLIKNRVVTVSYIKLTIEKILRILRL